MGKSDKRDARWDELAGLLRHMLTGLDRSLQESQRRFAAAPDEPFSARNIRRMVAMAERRGRDASGPAGCQAFNDLVFVSDTFAEVAGPVRYWAWDSLCGLVGKYVAELGEGVVTDVDSDSVDVRGLHGIHWPLEVPVAVGSDPMVLDVWSGFDELVARGFRTVRDLSVRWDVWPATMSSAVLDDAAACLTSLDSADYEEETAKRLAWN